MLESHTYGNMGLVKTTVELEDALYRTARKRAVDEARPFRAVLNDALRAYLAAAGPVTPDVRGKERRRRPARAAALPNRQATTSAAEFWSIVNDRSRWDELFGDRLREIEAQIAAATARWNRRTRR